MRASSARPTSTATSCSPALQVGAGLVKIRGDSVTPGDVVWDVSANACLTLGGFGTVIQIEYLDIKSSAWGLIAENGGLIHLGSGVRFDDCTSAHMLIRFGGVISTTVGYTVIGDGNRHVWLIQGTLQLNGTTITIPSALAFVLEFMRCDRVGLINVASVTFSGAGVAGTTGTRYNISTNAVINTGGGGATYLPGDAAGTTATGGQYV